jgi:hypothetical protein
MIGFVGHSQVVTTNNCTTLKIKKSPVPTRAVDYCNYNKRSLQRLLARRCFVTNLIWLTLHSWILQYWRMHRLRTKQRSRPPRVPFCSSWMRCVGNICSFPNNGLVLSVYNFQCPYPWKACFEIISFPGINLSLATRLHIRFLEAAHMSQYCGV